MRDSEERYRLLVEAVTDYAIYSLDPSGIVTSWNTGAQRLKGYGPEEIIGRHFSTFYAEEDRAAGMPQRALEISAREGKFEAEGWRLRKDGTRFWANVIVDPIRAPNGDLKGFAKITRDLTEKKRAEDALRRSQEQFRILVQGVTDYALYMLSPEGIVTSWNAGAERIKGYRAEEIVGQHFSKFYTEADRADGAPQRALDTAEREGRFEKEARRIRKDGTEFWSHIIIDPIRDDNGSLIGFAKITRDITERKQAQLALEEAREALFHSQKMDAVGQLTGGVAHDFNNLLMAIQGSLELLRKRLPDDPQMHRLIDNALRGARRGASLTKRMLAFARRQDLDARPVDLPLLVRSMTELLGRSLGSNAMIETQFPLALSKVMADENQLELALLNLCVNARDAMPEGGAIMIRASEEKIASRHESGLKPGRYVCLAVIDKGEGMSEETLARATEPFFTTKGVGKGTGLGLSMVHGMAEQMGGRLLLKSRKGVGTTAEIWLPVAAPSAAAADEPSTLPHSQQKPAHALRVLAVDDDALVLFNTSAMLEEMGHTVLEAESGAAALEVLRSGSVDVLITDQVMPRMTGLQLLDAVRAEWPELPVMLATGYAEIPGGVAVRVPKLTKPFSIEDLGRAIASLQISPKATATAR